MKKKSNLKFNSLFLFGISFITICPLSGQPQNNRISSSVDEKIVATVGNLKITTDEFKKGYDFGPAFYKREKKSKEVYLKFLINEKLLALDGYEHRVDTVKKVGDMIRAFHDDLITEELFKTKIFNKIKIVDAEIDSVIAQKQLEVQIKWLYTSDKEEAFSYANHSNLSIAFDSLYAKQCTDSSIMNDRQLKTNLYSLKLKNPVLAKIIDTLKAGEVSLPIHVQDGWYLVKLENISRNMILTETEMAKLRSESIEAVKKDKMDSLSEQYVVNLMSEEKPIIRKDEFNVLRSYIANYILPKEKYKGWRLAERMDSSLDVMKINDKDKLPNLILVNMKNGAVTLSEFLNWYWTRDQYIKMNEKDLTTYSFSLEQMIWRMVRDKLLVSEANKKNLSANQYVKDQERWWRDKIVYSFVKNELTNAVMLENKELPNINKDASKNSNAERLSEELSKKILRKVNQLKQKNTIKVYDNILNSISVTDENDPNAIELYTVKKGGLIPRTPYPSIDNDWKSWE